MNRKAIVFDLDDTLVDSLIARAARDSRQWRKALSLIPATTLYDGVRDLTKALDTMGIQQIVLTNSVDMYAAPLMRQHGLIMRLLAFHQVDRPKPAPDGVLCAAQMLKVKPQDIVGVGDALTDLKAYKAAGVMAIGAKWSKVFEEGSWDLLCSEPLDVLTLF